MSSEPAVQQMNVHLHVLGGNSMMVDVTIIGGEAVGSSLFDCVKALGVEQHWLVGTKGPVPTEEDPACGRFSNRVHSRQS